MALTPSQLLCICDPKRLYGDIIEALIDKALIEQRGLKTIIIDFSLETNLDEINRVAQLYTFREWVVNVNPSYSNTPSNKPVIRVSLRALGEKLCQ